MRVPWWHKALLVMALAIILGFVGIVAHALGNRWLPPNIAAMLGAAILAFASGYLFGEGAHRRRKRRQAKKTQRDLGSLLSEELARRAVENSSRIDLASER